MLRRFIIAAAMIVGSMVSPLAASPKIGDKAPEIRVAKWFTQSPAVLPGAKGAEKQIFLIEFWATWCPPCRKSIPHLATLHEKYGKDGLVVVGISNEEEADIEAFLKNSKVKMPYAVGADAEMATNDNWMDDIEGIPFAFVVDRENRVVWRGNPLEIESLEQTIKLVRDGKFDLEAARNAAANADKFEDLMKSLQMEYAALNQLEPDDPRRSEMEPKVLATLDQLIALKPTEMKPYLIKRQLLRNFNRRKEAVDFDVRIESAFKDSGNSMLMLAQFELATELGRRNPQLMLRSAQRANEIFDGRDAEALATLAQIECELGRIEDAVRHQKEALALATDEVAPAFKEVLDYYTAVRDLSVRDREARARLADENRE